MRALIDTDTLSEVIKWKDRTVAQRGSAYLAQHGCYTFSTITVMEVVKGLSRKGRETLIKQFLELAAKSEILTIDMVSAELAGRIQGDLEQRGTPIGTADLLIAAIAIRHDLPVVTGNLSDFRRVQDLGYPLVLDNWRHAALPSSPT